MYYGKSDEEFEKVLDEVINEDLLINYLPPLIDNPMLILNDKNVTIEHIEYEVLDYTITMIDISLVLVDKSTVVLTHIELEENVFDGIMNGFTIEDLLVLPPLVSLIEVIELIGNKYCNGGLIIEYQGREAYLINGGSEEAAVRLYGEQLTNNEVSLEGMEVGKCAVVKDNKLKFLDLDIFLKGE